VLFQKRMITLLIIMLLTVCLLSLTLIILYIYYKLKDN